MEGDFQEKLTKVGFVAGIVLAVVVWFMFPASAIHPMAYKVLSVATLMVIWWLTEAVPLAVTAMMSIVLFPLTGVMTLNEAATPFGNNIIFLFLGGFLIALAMERHNLHKRFAYHILAITGTSSSGIIAGFLIATTTISMWISNTATALMMLPIALSVIDMLRHHHTDASASSIDNFSIALLLVVGYGSSVGGMATIIGTPPNVVFTGLYQKYYHTLIPFGQWMLLALPITLVVSLLMYFLLTRVLFPCHINKVEGSREFINQQLKLLGPMSLGEKYVLAIFLVTSSLWILQQPLNAAFGVDLLNDTIIAISGGLLMFIVPLSIRRWSFVLEWHDTARLPWGILLLFGGGLCLANALEKTSIIHFIGNYVAAKHFSTPIMLLILIIVTVLISEVMSNVALVQVFTPVVFGISGPDADKALLLGIPVTLAASVGFMFPMATPPNAIVFGSHQIPIRKMVRAGLWLDIICIGIVFLFSWWWLPVVFAR